jgi:hypothetical protein
VTALKAISTAILGVLLFLSLAVFGIAFTLNSTLLNPDFVAGQVDKIDVSDLVEEFAEEQIADQVPEEVEFLTDVIYDVIDEEEPWIRAQVNTVVDAAYDFLLGKTETVNIVIPLEAKKEELRESCWTSFVNHVPEWLPELVDSELGPYLDRYIDDFAASIPDLYLPPEVINASTDYLELYLSNYLRDIAAMIAEDNIPEVTGLLESVVRPYFDEYYDDIKEQLPSQIVVNRSSIDDDTWDNLLSARQYIGYFRIGYYLLIAFMVLLVAGIFLINRNIRDSTRSLGISLLVYGVLVFAGLYVARHFFPVDLSFLFPVSVGVPRSLQTWLSGFYVDLLAPLQMLSISVMVIAVALIVVSFVYRRRGPDDAI